MPDPAELSRLNRKALAASYRAKSQGLNPETINGVTDAEANIVHHLQGAAEVYRNQGLSEDEIRARVTEDIERARR